MTFVQAFCMPLIRGCGQMLFQPSARTGSAFLLLILSQSVESFSLCLAGVVGATLCAYALEHPDAAYFEGLGGFNGALLGLALSAFYEFGAVLVVIALLGGGMTAVVRVALAKLLPVPPFTAPFVLVAWGVFACANLMSLAPFNPAPIDAWPLYGLTTNASQVLFLLHPWVGALVLVAVLLHSRTAALWVAAASLLAWFTAIAFNLPDDLTAAGLLGYNGLILAAALQRRGTSPLMAAAGTVASVCVTYGFLLTQAPPLSAPFVLCAWLVIAAESMLAGGPRGSAASR